jgi:hypothetical protein
MGKQPCGKQYYVKMKMPVYQISTFIEDRMMHVPIVKSSLTSGK